MSNGSVVMRGNCPFLVGNTAADPLFAALDRSNALSLSLGYIIGCGRPDSSGRHGGVAWRAWRIVSALMALRWVSWAHIFILTLMGVMLNDQYS